MSFLKAIKKIVTLLFLQLLLNNHADANVASIENGIQVPLAGNAYITQQAKTGRLAISKNGLINWTESASVISVYFRLNKTGTIQLSLRAKQNEGNSKIRVSANGKSFEVEIHKGDFHNYLAGSIVIADTGYVKVDLQGISKNGSSFGEISDLIIEGEAANAQVLFANDPANFYWSRRGPSCHLNYVIPDADKEYFYSELTVPVGEDKIGSYFMANGFGEGYFGIQVNSPTERRILFSVWDPKTGKTSILKKGENVHGGEFGGEGTGGQSYLLFNWKAGTTYKFLTRGKPDGAGNTIYSSWFYAPENGQWQLIASFKRENTNTWLTRFHGFLENFIPEQGYLSRSAEWSNQWVRLASQEWVEVTAFKMSADATAKNKQRMDYAGGVNNGAFFLRNGGFFPSYVTPNTLFTKSATGKAPVIDFSTLE